MELWTILFFVVSIGLFILPLMPALIELKWPTDDKPLKVVQEYDGNVRHFAQGFRRYVQNNVSQNLNERPMEGQLQDGTNYQVMGENALFPNMGSQGLRKMLVSLFPVTVPDSQVLESEMYSAQNVTTGSNNYMRALLSEQDIHMKRNSTILRWVHCEGTLSAEEECMLFGRASAEKAIVLSKGCGFERLNAPRIEFGRPSQEVLARANLNPQLVVVTQLDHVKNHFGRRWVLYGNMKMPSNSFFDGDIVAMKEVTIGTGSRIQGSLKSKSDFYIEDNVTVEGAVVSAGNLYIGQNCRIRGPVIAENILSVGTGTVIGREGVPASVSAPHIDMEIGTLVFGSVWATAQGLVIPAGHGSGKAAA